MSPALTPAGKTLTSFTTVLSLIYSVVLYGVAARSVLTKADNTSTAGHSFRIAPQLGCERHVNNLFIVVLVAATAETPIKFACKPLGWMKLSSGTNLVSCVEHINAKIQCVAK